ncbi:MAG: hypothetical protein KC561_15470, partial [Myxococcales bacterium]|nr:hypothetical protein [Myxococcales bacterium]
MSRARAKSLSPSAQRHADWLGMLQPEGLVLSVPVLDEANVYVRQELRVQEAIRTLCPDGRFEDAEHFWTFARQVLEWPEARIQRDEGSRNVFRLDYPDLDATLRPDAIV